MLNAEFNKSPESENKTDADEIPPGKSPGQLDSSEAPTQPSSNCVTLYVSGF
ncbi:MAG: hypothetical protein FWD57_02465 [Polyangiaceae bacterium]|nr:hypothetical protein [Polyangiaceae bacterium]